MKHFRRIYIYKDTNMPDRGWLQGCFICYQITGRLLTHDTKETANNITEYVVFVCPECKKQLENKPALKSDYNEKCMEYIKIHNL